jgi:signal transduction histidine kinase/ActR/RegA family two-component response regulator
MTSADSTAGRPDPAASAGIGGRIRSGLRLHHLLFLAFTLAAALPIGVLALWENNTSSRIELDSVRDRHLLIARDVTATLSRYIRDVEAVFTLTLDSGALTQPVAGLADVLKSLHVVHVAILAPNGSPEAELPGLAADQSGELPPPLLEELRTLAAAAHGQIAVSNLYHDPAAHPVFYLVKLLPRGRLGLGAVSNAYLLSLQQSLAFGGHGHAVITDGRGQVIAHPLKEWVAASRELSAVPVVAAMMRQETGVGQFFSPAFNTAMIAGYTVVPETGWGVMVAQPLAELHAPSAKVNQVAAAIALTAFAGAALLSWLLALYLARPVRQVAATAEAVLSGNDEVAVPQFRGLVPREIRRLGAAFNTMLGGLRLRAAETRQALQRAETSDAAKTQFLANMSHEIRTPLNGIVGMIELMRLTELSGLQQRYLDSATQSARALLRLVTDVLDLSRIQAGKLELECAPFHLPSLIHDVRALFAEEARAKGLSLSAAVPDSLNLVLLGDQTRLLQILTILVGNALKFTTEGGVALRGAVEDPAADLVRLRFEVADTGIGIPAGKQEVIFTAFNQADNSMTRRHGGIGLGLSIARHLVRLMDGEMGVDSVAGAGATVWFTVSLQRQAGGSIALPAAASRLPERKPADGAGSAAGFSSPSGRAFQAALLQAGRSDVAILLVEDNAANMRVTRALLETLGCHVTPARNGLEAVALYRENRFDLVLMDCQMPEMDGYEATRAIRQIEGFQQRRTPIVALTAHAMAGSREASLDSGMDDQITKPLTMAALTGKLLDWLAPAEVQSSS